MQNSKLKVFLFRKPKYVSPLGFLVLAACNSGGSNNIYVEADKSTTGSVAEGNIGDPTVSVTGLLSIPTNGDPAFANILNTAGDSGFGNFILTNGFWTYTLDQAEVQDLDQNDQISDSITFTATDGSTQRIDVTIIGTNDIPSLETSLPDQVSSTGSNFNFNVNTGFFNDLDADDTLTFSALQSDGSPLPDWLSFNAASGEFSGTSQTEDLGLINIDITATDSSNTSVSDTFTLTINATNSNPTLENTITDQVTAEDSTFNFQIPNNTFSDSDVDDTLSYTASLSDGSALPSWLTFNGATRTLSGTPENDDVGVIDITITANDGSSASVTDTFTLTVTNTDDAAVVSGEITGTINEGNIGDATVTATGTLAINDVDANDTPSFTDVASTTGDNDYGSFTLVESTWTYTLDQSKVQDLDQGDVVTDTTTFTASDGSTQQINVTITGTNDAAVVSGDITGTINEGNIGDAAVTATGTLAITDVDANDTPSFTDVASTTGENDYGSFTLVESTWTYTLDQSKVQDLDQNDQISDSITFTATDGSTQRVDVTIIGTNDIPSLETSLPDQVSSTGSNFNFNVNTGFFNDLDADDTLTFSALQSDGSPLPDWLSFNAASGEFSGTSQTEDLGLINIDITATDSSNTSVSDTFTLTINATNSNPTLENTITDQVTAEDSTFNFQIPNNTFSDSDVDDNLSYTASLSDGSALPSWLTFNGATRTLSGTPENDDVGAIDITITANDGSSASVTDTFTLTVTNTDDAAVVSGEITGTINEGNIGDAAVTATGTLAINDVDANDTPSFTDVASTTGENDYGSFTLVESTWTYTLDQSKVQDLDQGDVVTDTTTFTASDGSTQQINVAITGTNDAPTIQTQLVDQNALTKTELNYQFDENTFSDVDSDDSFVYQASLNDGSPLPTWLSFSSDDRTFSGSAPNTDLGSLTVRVSATDTHNFSISDDFNLSISFNPSVELSGIEQNSDGDGFVINGVAEGDSSGNSVSSAGDVNGDGLDDLIVGALVDDPNGNGSGASFVVFGKSGGAVVELSEIELGTNGDGFVINGVAEFDLSGISVSDAGDVNGDGLDDLIIGANRDDPNGLSSGASFVVFGKADGAAVELSEIELSTNAGGFVINGVAPSDYSGTSVSSAGDVNGDGFDDLIIGANGDDPNGLSSGASFVVFGKADGAAVELSTVEAGSGGFVINGVSAGDSSGRSVSSAGDVNGDGLDDLIIGARSDDPNGSNSGASFVVFGKADGTKVELSDIELGTSEGGFVINGVAEFDQSGFSVSSAGDVNGDGFDDLIIGAQSDDPNGSYSGASFVVFGKANGAAVELSTVEAGSGGFVINGVSTGDKSGYSVSSAGDVNGDGFDDLIIGAQSDDPNGESSGASFVVFGKADGAKVELSTVEAGSGGFVINGANAFDASGASVSSAGDVNGDGFDDLIIGAQSDDPNGSNSGASFVVFGGDFTGAATQVGTTGADTLTGTAGNDVLIAGTGDDTLIGSGGADVLRGGAGNDILAVSTSDFTKIEGGSGTDTLRLDGTDLSLDFRAIADNAITEIEVIDLNGQGNSVSLDVLEVLRLSDSSNTVRILGDNTDTLSLSGFGWTTETAVTEAGITFDVFSDGEAVIQVQQGITRLGGPIAAVELSEVETNSDLRGFVINGVAEGDSSGTSVSRAGDVNGDGLDDLIVGALVDDPNGNGSGASFVVFGKSGGAVVELSEIELGTNGDGFVINGVAEEDLSGISISDAGDVNGDGLDDLIIGANRDDPNGLSSGASFVVFGKADGAAVELSEIELGTNAGGFVINGVAPSDYSGTSVSSAGDVNGDGFDDLIIGANGDDPNGLSSGASFVVFGKADGAAVELSTVEAGSGGFVINGVSAGDSSGRSVSSAGDVNGDGLDDLIIGAQSDDPNGSNSGASFVVFGKADGAKVELSDIELGTSEGGFVINGVAEFDQSGFSVSSAGDVNGDGLDDLIVGAQSDDPNGNSNSGASFVVFGKANGAAVELSTVEAGSGGFVINGVSTGDKSGYSVSSAGDVNGDGFDDLIIGASFDDPNGESSGASFVVFGKADGAKVELSTVEAGSGGFVINGANAFDASGASVSSAGDVNGDGFDDLIIGAQSDDPNGSNSGASFVVFGGDFTGAATQVGTTGADTLTGTAGNDVLIAGTGDDTLIGSGGADVLRGGAGDDILAISTSGFTRIEGGSGTDTLRLDGTDLSLDFRAIADGAITEIEVIDLNGQGNSVSLNTLEVLRLSDSSNTVRILGDNTDTLSLSGLGWTAGTAVTEAGITFDVFSDGEAVIQVQQGVTRLGGPIAAVELSEVETNSDLRGFVINGAGPFDRSGTSVSSAGDVNGDGFDDLIIGAYGNSPNGSYSGASFVVFGKADGAAVELSEIELSTNAGGFVINGVEAYDYSGGSVSSAGDVNGDGFDDLIIGANGDDPNGLSSGASFVVFGKADGAAVELSEIELSTNAGGFVINGVAAYDYSGTSVSSAGDVNGDGFDDLIIGARNDNPNGNGSGASFVVFGKADGTKVELSDIELGTSEGGFVINGVAEFDRSGFSVSSAGDVNGDGFDDLIIGADGDDPNGDTSGASFVVFGKADGAAVELSEIELSTSEGGFVINGVAEFDRSGFSVSSAGDVNGDGLDDLIVGAQSDDPNGNSNSGASFVVFGKANGAAVELSTVEAGSGGFVINGVAEFDRSGFSVSSAGDVNGDGLDDLIVGAQSDDPNGSYSGASFVVFGKADGAKVELSTVEAGSGGFVINGVAADDQSGTSVSSAGDVNGDGFDDLIIGAQSDDPNGSNSGASFVVFGGDFTGAATQVGTTGADTLTGTAGNDVLIAGTGDDTLIGSGGADVLRGGAGDDILAISTSDFTRIEGGSGTDTLRLDGSGMSLDFRTIADGAITEIEVIDLNGQGNSVSLDVLEVLRLSDSSNTVRILGDNTDTLSLSGFGWTTETAVTEAGITFDVFSDGEAVIQVQQGITRLGGPIAAVELSEVETNSDLRGFVINGANAFDYSGASVSSAGDVNGDGFDDLIIGARNDDPNGLSSGASFVVFGKADGAAVELSEIELSTNAGGFVINGANAFDYSGRSVSSAGDVNGDGFDDLIIGASRDDPNGNLSGASFVVFGKADGAAVELSEIELSTNAGGFVINGVAAYDYSGTSVSSAGDVNGDGFDDLIIGARGDDPNGSNSGASFVVFGKADGTKVELSEIEKGTNEGGFVINGVSAGDVSSGSVSSAGDVNGDGFDDLIIGANGDDPNGNGSGASFVVFGKADGVAVKLSTVEAGSGGFVINGVAADDQSGTSVSSAGDVNGDGFDDLIIGANRDDPNGSYSGASFVVFGKADGTKVELSEIELGTNAGGFVINGVAADDQSGTSVSSAGDVNGDGLDDLIIGAPNDDPNGLTSGASFVVFGKADGAAVELSTVEAGTGGFVINGVSGGDVSSGSVSDAGDVNGDGFDDLIIGARSDDPNGSYSGASFVVFGGDFTGAATQVGTTGADTLTGTAGNDVLIAGTGDDTLIGSGGADVLRGGAGDDILAISTSGFTRIEGGSGTDTLRLDGTDLSLDFRAIADNAITEIEVIDLNGQGNSVSLDVLEVLRLSDSSNTVRILGDNTDTLSLSGFGWTTETAVTEAGITFDVFSDGEAVIQVQQGITRLGGPIAAVELSEVETNSDLRGFVINGVSPYDFSGRSVSSAGDVNGDGFDDLIIGANRDDPNGDTSGASFVVFGKADGAAVELSEIELSTNAGGFVINGVAAYDYSGYSVSSAGDVNGDGFDDLIIGADGDDPNGNLSGASFVVFGKADGTKVELSEIELGTNAGGFVINGVAEFDQSGYSVSSAGDVNGDGLDDLIVGAQSDDPNGLSSGASFVVFGKADGTKVELSEIEKGTNAGGFVINGVSAGDVSSGSVSSAGDVNGDGFDDLIIGARGDDPNGNGSGASFVVFGKADGVAVKLSTVEAGSGGFVINGVAADDMSGTSVSSAGDVNGDGFDDLIIGANRDDPNGSYSGASFVVFGKADGTKVELSEIEKGTNAGGFVINGVAEFDQSGFSVSSAGDVNGDGLDDLIIGANNDPNGLTSRASFVVFGKADGAAVELSTVEAGTGGFVINGVSGGDVSSGSVSDAGDVNGDGFDDLIIGANRDDPNGSNSGASFVVFGGDFTGAATQVGTTGADTLTGTAGNDVLIAGTGDDTLIGSGGADVLRGGAGNDILAVSTSDFTKIEGGSGTDTLRLDGTGLSLDFRTIADSAITEIEIIDLNGQGNLVSLDVLEVLRLSDSSNTVRILGDNTDGVTLYGASWNTEAAFTDSFGTFVPYSDGNAEVYIPFDINPEFPDVLIDFIA